MKEFLKYFDLSDNKSTDYLNLWDVVRAELREEFVCYLFVLEIEEYLLSMILES